MANEVIQEQVCPGSQMEMEPTYYVECGYYWPEFIDKGSFVYSQVRFCSHVEKLDCHTLEEAEAVAAQRNETIVCPVCGKRGKMRATTDFDMMNDQQIINHLINNVSHVR